MDLITRVQSELTLGEKCLKCSKGILLKDNNKIDCLLALVSRNLDTGLIIFQWQSDTSVHDSLPFILYVLAIHGPFSIATVAGSESNKDIVRFQVLTDDQTKLVFEIKKDDQGKSFLTELNRAIEAYRQRAHMVGIPEFKWLERYQEMIGRKSFISSGGWPWNHLDEGGFSGSQVVVTEDEPEGDVFGMPGFSPASSIHPSVSVGSLFGLDDTDATANSSPALPRRSLPSTSIGARDGFIRFNMDQRENEFTHTKRMKIFIGTWNVNEQVPTKQVSSWLSLDDDPPDLFVLGFQELDLTADSFLKKDLPREEVWLKVMEQGLHPKGRYIKVKSIRLVGILLMVFIEKKHVPHVKDIYAESVATGIMGLMGNKGGVAVRLQIHNTTFCFVNSHLKAHLEEIERRNQDYKDILGKLKFEGPYGLISILDHKIIIWLGDLNYRIGGMDNIEARRLADKGEYEPLLVNDQLTQQRNQKKCFEGFHEGSITFKPTYRYDPGTDNWDTSEKCRIPAWCDRILWRTAPNVEIGLMKYRSHNALKLSDHKPVSALFDVGVRVVDEAQERRVLEDVIRKLDRQENENLPQVQLGSTEIIFKDVKFLEKQTAGLEIVNTGQVSAQFAFIAKLDEIDYCKPWLSVKPPMGVISPGSTKRVKIIVYVDKESARVMNSGEEKLEDILVLHLEGGKDFFVSVSGNYLPSVFGSSIEALVRMYGPIREVPVATLVDLEHMNTLTASSLSNTAPLEVPKELWLLTDHLFKFGMKEDNILRQNGLKGELEEIRTHLDCCKGGKLPGSIHAVAEALLIFLEALSEPVIPYAFYQRALECCNNYMLCKQLIRQMPESHRNVFTYVSSFLRELLLYSDDNKLDAKTLATLIGTLFLRAPKNSEAGLSKRTQNQQTQKKARFMYHFLVNDFGPTR